MVESAPTPRTQTKRSRPCSPHSEHFIRQPGSFPLERVSRRLAQLPPTPRRAGAPRRRACGDPPARPGRVPGVRGGGGGGRVGPQDPSLGKGAPVPPRREGQTMGAAAPGEPGPRPPRPCPPARPPSAAARARPAASFPSAARPPPPAPAPGAAFRHSRCPAAAGPLFRSDIFFSISLLFSEVVEMSYFNFHCNLPFPTGKYSSGNPKSRVHRADRIKPLTWNTSRVV